jgi:hypothetical protein
MICAIGFLFAARMQHTLAFINLGRDYLEFCMISVLRLQRRFTPRAFLGGESPRRLGSARVTKDGQKPLY